MENRSRRRLFEQRMDALYVTDEDGRIVSTNEWDGRPAPRFHLMRTAEAPIVRFGAGVAQALKRDLEALIVYEPRGEGPRTREPALREAYLERLAAHAPIGAVWSGPAFVATRVIAPVRATVTIDGGNADLLRPLFGDWLADVSHRQPFLAMVEDGRAVSICASVRISEAVHCAGVETHPDHRRRGHALEVVAGWARAVRALGATPFYSTSWNNLGSQHVAARLAFELAGADFHVA